MQDASSDAKAKKAILSLADDDNAKRLLLIEQTHSDARPDPLRTNNFYEFDEFDSVVWIAADGRNHVQWDTSNSGFYEDLEELEIPEERIEQLVSGTSPTSEERAAYRELILEKDSVSYPINFEVCCLAAPEDTDESRVIYFTWDGDRTTYSPGEYTGPWRNINEVLPLLDERYEGVYCIHDRGEGEMPSPEEVLLDAWLAKKQADDDARYAEWLKTQE